MTLHRVAIIYWIIALGLVANIALSGENSASNALEKTPDWKFYAFTQADVSAPDAMMVFYSAGDLKRLPAGRVRVWTKFLNAKEVTGRYNSIDEHKELLDRASAKAMTHYERTALRQDSPPH
jgi:hypothetical protein